MTKVLALTKSSRAGVEALRGEYLSFSSMSVGESVQRVVSRQARMGCLWVWGVAPDGGWRASGEMGG